MQQAKSVLKHYLSKRLCEWRKASLLTQEEASEKFHISPRAYGDLERGKYCISAVVLVLFLCLMDEDRLLSVIRMLREEIFKIPAYEYSGGK